MIVARVRRTIRERHLIAPGMRVLAACSGGPDSSAMLVALARLRKEVRFDLEVASVDHGLRPTAAEDVAIAARLAAALGLAFHPLRVSVETRRSVQAAARAERYGALLALATHIGAERVAVGHTQDDQAETVLLRILRGAGLSGLSSIGPARADGVIRPLIDCRRSEVAAFAARHCGDTARDPSNVDPRFARTRVRRELLPSLAREDAAIVQHLADLADDARAAEAALRPHVEALLQRSFQGDDIIDVSTWIHVPHALRVAALRSWLHRIAGLSLGRRQLVELEDAISAAAEIWLPGGYTVASEGRGMLRLLRAHVRKTQP